MPTNAVTTNESERALVALRNQFADDRQFRVALQHSGFHTNSQTSVSEAIRGEPGLRIKLLRKLPFRMGKFRIISSSTKPNSCNQYEFAPDTFSGCA